MSRKFDTALDDCMNLLRTGASTADCLARYPEHAEELRPLLSITSAVKAVPTPRPDPAAVRANRQRMLDAVQTAATRRQRRGPAAFAWFWRLSSALQVRPLLRTALTLAAAVVVVSLASGALFTSAADSFPGQALYPVKRFGENVRLSLTLNPAARQELQTEYVLERRHEVRQVLDAGQRAVLEFRAELEEIGDGYWIIGGLKVMLDSDTLVEGHVAVGVTVIVRASSSVDGTLRALKLQIQANPLLLTSVIPATPTPTPTVTPTPSTTPTPTPTVMPTPSTTPTPAPTVTPTPSPMPTETSTPLPTATSTPTHTEEPESTDPPDENETEEPESTDYPDPTHTEEPDSDDEPEPTDTEESESGGLSDLHDANKPRSTNIPDPTHTEEPDSTDQADPISTEEPDSADGCEPTETDELESGDPPDLHDANEPRSTNSEPDGKEARGTTPSLNLPRLRTWSSPQSPALTRSKIRDH